MECEEFAHMLDCYESLSEDEKTLLDIHADTCKGCKHELDLMLSIMQATKTLPEIQVPEDFLANLNARIDAENSRKTTFVQYLKNNRQRYSALAACMLLAAIVGSNYNTLMKRLDQNVVVTDNTATPMPKTNGEANKDNREGDKASSGENDRKTDFGAGIPALNIARGVQSDADIISTSNIGNVTAHSSASQGEKPQMTTSPSMNRTVIPEEGNTGYELSDDRSLSATFAMRRGVYVEGDDDISATSSPTDEQDSSYLMSEQRMGEPKAESEDSKNPAHTKSSPKPDNSGDYNIENMIIVSSDDYNEALDIIQKYLTGYDDEYYVANRGDIETMLKRLEAEGIGFDDYITVDSNEVTFRVMSE